MKDTQWPRFQVFLQARQGEPHQDVGSVHAPDAELALQNARDVFVRRPECHNLWVIPAAAIYSKTAGELENEGFREDADLTTDNASAEETYYVFNKARSAGTQTLVGALQARSAAHALRLALEESSPQERPPFAWWVIPARLVVQNSPDEAESMFAPSLDKPYRLATDFHTHTAMQELKKR
jgi:ring-1,2-phenylacetyl-CoA epoxidase subunit PaaB